MDNYYFSNTTRKTSKLLYETFQTGSLAAPVLRATPPENAIKPLFNLLGVKVVGLGSIGQVVLASVIGWKKEESSGLYVPQELAKLTATLGATVGLAGNVFLDENVRFAKSIVVADSEGLEGSTSVLQIRKSTGEVTEILLDILGYQYVTVDVGVGDATSGNVIVSSL